MLKLAAALSRGLPLPCDDDKEYEPIHIIYQTAEDGIEDTIKPRLEKAGANCFMIRVIDETDKELSMTDDRLEQAIIETKARLIILDPIQAYIGATVDMHRANEIRPVLKHLGMIAEKYNCAIVLIGHMNKAAGSKSTYRGLGSIDIQATARSVLLVARLRDKPNIRIMAHDKSSLAPTGDAIGFEMTEESGMICITWKCRYVEYNVVYGQFQSVPQEESNSCHSNCDKEIFCHPLYEEDIRNQDKNYIPMCKPFRRFITKQKD